jgi:hypothetical protein
MPERKINIEEVTPSFLKCRYVGAKSAVRAYRISSGLQTSPIPGGSGDPDPGNRRCCPVRYSCNHILSGDG